MQSRSCKSKLDGDAVSLQPRLDVFGFAAGASEQSRHTYTHTHTHVRPAKECDRDKKCYVDQNEMKADTS